MRTALFGRITDDVTAHVVNPGGSVFAEPPGDAAPYLLPLVSVRLASLPFALHVVYCEMTCAGSELRFAVRDDGYALLTSATDLRADGPSPLVAPPRWKGTHLALVEVDVPERADPPPWGLTPAEVQAQEEAARRWSLYDPDTAMHERAVDRAITRVDPKLRPLVAFGAEPRWTQSPRAPLDPDGNPMVFVGQVRADAFTDHVADLDLYLFASVEHRLVVQIAQGS